MLLDNESKKNEKENNKEKFIAKDIYNNKLFKKDKESNWFVKDRSCLDFISLFIKEGDYLTRI